MSKPRTCSFHLVTAALLLAASTLSQAQRPGDLIISPTRVVLDEHSKSSDLSLLNRGMRPIRYRLSLVDMEMSQSGILRRVEATPATSAVNILRLSPREIVLEPGVAQRIRIAAFLPPDQADGELRSHLVFEPITASVPPSNSNPDAEPQLRLSLEFRSVVSIPVLVRHGHLGAAATLSDASLVSAANAWTARVKVSRTGNRSLRGNLIATFVSADRSRKVELGQILGLAVYCPNADRIVDLKLDKDPASLGKGTLEIQFSEADRSRGAAAAKTEIPLPG